MGRLVGARPKVDGALVGELAFKIERAFGVRPGLRHKVDAFPQPLDGLRRVAVGGEHFVRHAAHEADIETAARDAIDHRHLFGDADRVLTIGDRIAENADPALARLAREDGGGQRRAGVDAGRRLMMLVEQHVEADFVGKHVFVEIAVVKISANLGIEELAGDRHAHRRQGVERRQVRIGHLGEVPGVHGAASLLMSGLR